MGFFSTLSLTLNTELSPWELPLSIIVLYAVKGKLIWSKNVYLQRDLNLLHQQLSILILIPIYMC